MDELLDSAPFFLTGNTDTVYLGGFLDLKQDGPTVVEIPPGSGPGTVNDAWSRFRTRITQRTREQLNPDSSWEGRAGSRSSGSTAHSNPGTTRHGGPATSN